MKKSFLRARSAHTYHAHTRAQSEHTYHPQRGRGRAAYNTAAEKAFGKCIVLTAIFNNVPRLIITAFFLVIVSLAAFFASINSLTNDSLENKAGLAATTYTVVVDMNGGTRATNKWHARPSDESYTEDFEESTTLTYGITYNLWNFGDSSYVTKSGFKYGGIMVTGTDPAARWNYWKEGAYKADKEVPYGAVFATESGDINFSNLTSRDGGVVKITILWLPTTYSSGNTYTLRIDMNGGTRKSVWRSRASDASGENGTDTFTEATTLIYGKSYNVWEFSAASYATKTGYHYAGIRITGVDYHALWGDWDTDGQYVAEKELLSGITYAPTNGDLNFKNLTATNGATVTLTIIWEADTITSGDKKYTVKIDLNGGISTSNNFDISADDGSLTGSFTSYMTLVYGKTYHISDFSSTAFVAKAGYHYAGMLMSNGDYNARWGDWDSGGHYVANDELLNDSTFASSSGSLNFKNLTATNGATVTLTIQWVENSYTSGNTYTVKINMNGGEKLSYYYKSRPSHESSTDIFTESTTLVYGTAYNIWNLQASSYITKTGYKYAGIQITGADSNARWGYWGDGNYVTNRTFTNGVTFGENSGDLNFKNLNATNGATVTITVLWIEDDSYFSGNTYTVRIDMNGGERTTSRWRSRPSNASTSDAYYTNLFTECTTLVYGTSYNIWNFASDAYITRPGFTYGGLKMSGADSNARWGYWNGDGAYVANRTISNGETFASDKGDLNFKNLTATNGGTVTLTIQWIPNTYTVKIDINGGKKESAEAFHYCPSGGSKANFSDSGGGIYTATINYGTSYNIWNFGAAAYVTRAGYHYVGIKMTGEDTYARWGFWNDDGQYVANRNVPSGETFAYKANSDGNLNFRNLNVTSGAIITITIQWEPNTYSVSYNGNPGTASASVQNLPSTQTDWVYDSSHTLGSAPSLLGWSFDGWYRETGCTNKVGNAGASASNLTTTNGGSVTLFAKWLANTCNITYVLGGGANGSHALTEWTYDTADYVSAPTRAGYTFTGWTVSGADSSTAKWGTSSSPSTAISNSSTNCFNTATGNVYFKNLTPTNGGSVTFTAHWTAKTFTLSYDAQGGTTPSSKSVTFASEFGTLATTTRTGYTFQGWSLLPAGYQQVEYIQSAGNGNTENVGGYILTDITPNGNSSIRMVAEPTATEQYHAFWVARGATYSTNAWSLFGFPNGSYRFDYGNSVSGSTTATYSTTKTILTAEKNTFYIGSTLGYAYTALSDYTAGGPLMFMASYYDGTSNHIDNRAAVKIYGITYWNNGTVAAYLVPCYRTSDSKIGLYDIVGGNFYGGTGTLTKGADVYVNSTTEFAVGGNTTLYARWTANTYTVYFNGNKPNDATANVVMTGVPESATWTYDRNETLPATEPRLNGWTFAGWYKNQACSNNMKLGDANSLTSTPPNLATGAGTDTSYTLYAGWTKNSYTVTYNANKPTGEHGASANVTGVPSQGTWEYDSSVTLGAAPTLMGWTFEGWYKESTCANKVGNGGEAVSKPNLVMSGSTNVYAKWTANKYTVSYKKNKPDSATGSVSSLPSDDVKTYDIAFTLATTPTLTGWTFGGWYSESTCQEANKVGNAGESVTNLTATNGATFDIYAKWTANTYTVVYNGNKPSNATSSVGNIPDNGTWYYDSTVTFGGEAILTGWTFVGWYQEAACENVVSTTKPNLATGEGEDDSCEIFAKWTANQYTVQYSGNKPENLTDTVESVPSDEDWTYDSDGTLASAPTLTGWTFIGWYQEAICVNKVGDEDENLTKPNLATGTGADTTYKLYAGWALDKPTVSLKKEGSASNFEVTYDVGSTSLLTATATHECGQVQFSYLWTRTKEGEEPDTIRERGASAASSDEFSAPNDLTWGIYQYTVTVSASYNGISSEAKSSSITMTIKQKVITVTIVEKTTQCVDEYGPVVVSRSGEVLRTTDTDCDVFGKIRRDGESVNSVKSAHTDAKMFDGYKAAFDGLSEAYARFRADDTNDGRYTSFYTAARELFNNSFRDGTGEIEYAEGSGAVFGIVGDTFISARSNQISSSRDVYTELLSRLFGFSSKESFVSAATYLGTTFAGNGTNDIGANATNKRLVYRGGIYTSSGVLVLPYSIAVLTNENWVDKVILFIFVTSEGKVSAWVNSYENLCLAANASGENATRVRVYGRCELFDTPYYMYDGTAKDMVISSATGACAGHLLVSMSLEYNGSASVKNAGSYTVSVGAFCVKTDDESETDVTENYRIEYAGSGTMVIEKMRLVFRPNDAFMTYSGNAYAGTIAYTLGAGDRLVHSGTHEDATYTLKYNNIGSAPSSAGEYVISINTMGTDITIASGSNESYTEQESNYDTVNVVYLTGYLKIGKLAVTVTMNDYNNTYGVPITSNDFSYTAKDEYNQGVFLTGVTPSYSYGVDEEHMTGGFSGLTGTIIDPGTYLLRATLEGSSNYDFTYVDGTMTIDTRHIRLLLSSETTTYGTAATMVISENEEDAYKLLSGDVVTMEYEYSVDGENWTDSVIDAGTYVVRAKAGTVNINNGARNGYYTVESVENGQLTINKKPLIMTVTSSVTYNGLAREYVPFGTEGSDLLTWSCDGCVDGESFGSPVFRYATANDPTTPISAPKDVGSYVCGVASFVITGGRGNANNYEIEAWNYTITPFTPSIVIGADSLTYNNADHAYSGAVTITLASGESGAADESALGYTYYAGEYYMLSDLDGKVAMSGLPRNAGVYTVRVMANTASVCPTPDNYGTFSYVNGGLAIITISQRELTLTAEEETFPYNNGDPIGVTGVLEGWADGETVEGRYSLGYVYYEVVNNVITETEIDVPTTVGTYGYKITATLGEALKGNYCFVSANMTELSYIGVKIGTMVIADRRLTFEVNDTLETTVHTYDGRVHTPDLERITMTGDGLLDGDTVLYTFEYSRSRDDWSSVSASDGGGIDAGIWYVRFSVSVNRTTGANYSVTIKPGSILDIEIDKRVITVDVDSQVYTYNCQEQSGKSVVSVGSIVGAILDGETEIRGADRMVCDYSYKQNDEDKICKDVGTYDVNVTGVRIYQGTREITDNYDITIGSAGTVRIDKARIEIRVADVGADEVYYDGSVKDIAYYVNGGSWGDTITATFSYEKELEAGENEDTGHVNAGMWDVLITKVTLGEGVDKNNYESDIDVVLENETVTYSGTDIAESTLNGQVTFSLSGHEDKYSYMRISPKKVNVILTPKVEEGYYVYDRGSKTVDIAFEGVIAGNDVTEGEIEAFSGGVTLVYTYKGENVPSNGVFHAGSYSVALGSVRSSSLLYAVRNYAFESEGTNFTVEKNTIELKFRTDSSTSNIRTKEFTLGVQTADLAELSSETPAYQDGIRINKILPTLKYKMGTNDPITELPTDSEQIGEWNVEIASVSFAENDNKEIWDNDYRFNIDATSVLKVGPKKVYINLDSNVEYVYNGNSQEVKFTFSGLLNLSEVGGKETITVLKKVETTESTNEQPFRNAGDYRIKYLGVEYAYEGEGNGYEACYEWVTEGYNNVTGWTCRIEPKLVQITIEEKNNDSYTYNKGIHELIATATGLVGSDASNFEYTLAYSYQVESGTRVWATPGANDKWYEYDVNLPGRKQENGKDKEAQKKDLPINAGTLDVKLFYPTCNNIDTNYNYVYEDGVMTIDQFRTNIVLGGEDIEYDGKEHGVRVMTEPRITEIDPDITLDAALEACLVEEYESDPENAVWQESIVRVGYYYVRVREGGIQVKYGSSTEDESGNYEFIYPDSESYGTLRITPKKLTIQLENYVGVYNGQEHTPDGEIVGILEQDKDKEVGVNLSYLFTNQSGGAGDNVNANENVSGGNCYAKVVGAEFAEGSDEEIIKNYYFPVTDISNRVTITIRKAVVMFVIDSTSQTYNGEEHEAVALPQIIDPETYNAETGDGIVHEGAYGDDVIEPVIIYLNGRKNAGTCEVEIRRASAMSTNYELISSSGSFEIEPLTVTVSFIDAVMTYDGKAKGLSLTYEPALKHDHADYVGYTVRYSLNGATIDGSPTNAEASAYIASITEIGLNCPIGREEENGNYVFTYSSARGSLTIEKADYDFSDFETYLLNNKNESEQPNHFTAEYNGKDQVPDFGDNIPKGADVRRYYLEAVFDGSVKEVSDEATELHVTFVGRRTGEDGVNWSPNYNIPDREYTIYFQLVQKTVQVEWGSTLKEENGDQKFISVGDRQYLAVEYNGKGKDNEGRWMTVPTATIESGSIVLIVEITTENYQGNVSFDERGTLQKSYAAKATLEGDNARNYNLQGEYRNFVVMAKKVSVQFSGHNLVYNGTELTIDARIADGQLLGDDVLPLLVKPDRAVLNAGDYSATVEIIKDAENQATYCYELVGNTFTFSVAKRNATIMAKDTSSVYGEAEATIGYTSENFCKDDLRRMNLYLKRENGQKATEGGLTVWHYEIVPSAVSSNYKVEKTGDRYFLSTLNYNIAFIKGTYTVYPKNIVVIVHDQTQIDPNSSELNSAKGVGWDVAEVDAIVEGDDLEITLTTTVDLNDPKVKYGVIKATYKNTNYNVLFVGDRDESGEYAAEGKFIITKQQAVLRIKDRFLETYPNNSKVYDEKPTRILIDNIGSGSPSYFVNGVASDNNFIEPGIYNIVIKAVAKSGYYPPEDLKYTFTIYPREIETDFGDYKATIQDSAGYSTTATFSLVVDKTAENDILNSFSATEAASTKQITEFYFLQSDGNVSGSMQLDLSKEYKDGDKVTLYIYKNSGEYVIETYQVQNGIITIENADQIQGIGFISDDNGPGFMMLALYICGGLLLLAIFFIPILARKRH